MIARGLGFFVANGAILTAFQTIDGATSVRVDFADASSATVTGIAAWNRAQDWAILKVNAPGSKPLEQAAINSWKVGDLCYLLTSQGQNSRTIQTVNITGMQGTGSPGQRLTITNLGPEGWLGAPLLNSYGRLIGILSGGMQGTGNRRLGIWNVDPDPTGAGLNPTVLPISAIPPSAVSQQPTAFSTLAAEGVLIMPVVSNPQAAVGVLCEDFRNFHGEAIVPVQLSGSLSRSQGHFSVVITWGPSEKVRGLAQLRVYDLQNHPLLQTAPSKIKLEPRVSAYSAWKLPTASLQPGVYRIDLLLDGQPEWRAFFRLSP